MMKQSKILHTGKSILITGAARGIGKAIKETLKDHYNIITPSREELDLSSIQSIENYFKNNNLEIDILINNAGINIIKDIDSILDRDIDEVFQTNLKAPLKLIQKVVPHMKKQKYGKIVNISSIWGIKSKELRALYSSTKFGLIGQTKALARELAQDNILINAVCPGFTATDLTMQSLSKEQLDSIIEQIPMKRLAEPKEIANTVKFLISDDNSYITGQTLVVDGGFTS